MMNYLFFPVLAYLLNGITVLIDKFLLTKNAADPLVYVFYFSLFSLVAMVIAPFTPYPSTNVLIIASISTLLWTIGAYFMFLGLKIGQASRVIPVIGSLIPVLLIIYYGAVNHSLSDKQLLASLVLTAGLLTLIYRLFFGRITFKETLFELLSAMLYAASYIFLKQAFLQANYLTVFAWSRLILFPVGLVILAVPFLRHKALSVHGDQKINLKSKASLLFFTGQAAGGSGELLLTYAVSLASPALVNSVQGVQYAFLLLASLMLGKKYPRVFTEKWSLSFILEKTLGILLIGYGLYLLAIAG